MDLRRGQAHRLHLQGVVGTERTIAPPQIPPQNRSFFAWHFGKNYFVIFCVTCKEPLFICTATATNVSLHRTTSDDYRVTFDSHTIVVGIPPINGSLHRAATDINRVVFGRAF